MENVCPINELSDEQFIKLVKENNTYGSILVQVGMKP